MNFKQVNYYETDRALSEYLLFHYGTPPEILPYPFGPADALEYPARCVRECLDAKRLKGSPRGLDLGCAVGRAAFELARFCSRVIGIDYSQAFVECAARLQREGRIDYSFVEEGSLVRRAQALVPPDIDRTRVSFEQGDAQKLRRDLGRFDAVLMANLIDRLGRPRDCLDQLPDLLQPGGQLIITSPYTWLSEYTPQEHWLGGFEREGQPLRTLQALQAILEPDFQFMLAKDLPFLIREHARKYQWSVAQASVWIRKE